MNKKNDNIPEIKGLEAINFSTYVVILWVASAFGFIFLGQNETFLQFFIPTLFFSFFIWPIYTLINPGAVWTPFKRPKLPPHNENDSPSDYEQWKKDCEESENLWIEAMEQEIEEEEKRQKEFSRLYLRH